MRIKKLTILQQRPHGVKSPRCLGEEAESGKTRLDAETIQVPTTGPPHRLRKTGGNMAAVVNSRSSSVPVPWGEKR